LGAKLDVHSISVARALPPSEDGFPAMCRQPEGTVVTLLVQVPHFSVIELDKRASRLSKFIDDKGNDLLKPVPRDDVPVRGVTEPVRAVFQPIRATETSETTGHETMERGSSFPVVPLTPIARIDFPLITSTPIAIAENDEEMEAMHRVMMEAMDFTPPPLQMQMVEQTAGKWILIDCKAENRPAPGTQLVTLEGQLVLHCGQEIKTTEHKNIPLDGTGKFEFNGTTVTVKKAERGKGFGDAIGDAFVDMFGDMFGGARKEVKMSVSLTSSKRPINVISYTFLDADGNEIEQGSRSASWSDQIHVANFDLTEEVDSLTIRLKAYERMETITLPFSLQVGLGL